jgi:H+/gluconate symporter-like permease
MWPTGHPPTALDDERRGAPVSDVQVLLTTAAAVLVVVLLVVRLQVNPVVSLVVGAVGLGLATGQGVEGTLGTVTGGFGSIMAEVGLLIGFGVLMGAMLDELGAIRRLVAALLRVFGPQRLPYTFGLALATVLQSIFIDVMLVISAPLARRVAPHLGPAGTARMATAIAIGLETGIVLVVPGIGALALAGLLGVPLGQMLLLGVAVTVPTVVVSVAIMSVVLRRTWDPAKDEQPVELSVGAAAGPAGGAGRTGPAGAAPDLDGDAPAHGREPRLLVLFAPLLAALVLIASGALAEVAGLEHPVVLLLSDPVVALLLGVLGTSAVGRATAGRERVVAAVGRGFAESGQILLLTGVGGSLAATVEAAGLGDVLGQYFSAGTSGALAGLVLVWAIAAVLHVAVGSVTISAITAAGVLAPVVPTLGLAPVLVALAAGAGSLFLVHVTSNTFWLLQSLLGQSTRGTLKTCSLGVSVASVVALGFVLLLALVL